MAKFSISAYWHPTPKKVRKIGLAIASLGATIGTSTEIYAHFAADEKFAKLCHGLAVSSAVLGWLGKEITNFWSDDETPTDNI